MKKRKASYQTPNYSNDDEMSVKIPCISKDLESLPFTHLTKIEANKLYIDLQLGQKRADSRKAAIIFCIYQVYLNRDEYMDVAHIGEKVGLDRIKSEKAICEYSCVLIRTEIPGTNHSGEIDPEVMIDYYTSKDVLGLNDLDIAEIKELYETISEYDIDFGQSKKAIVASVIYFWIKQKQIPFDERKYLKAFPGVHLKKIKEIYQSICLYE
jgi:hypothetical protein